MFETAAPAWPIFLEELLVDRSDRSARSRNKSHSGMGLIEVVHAIVHAIVHKTGDFRRTINHTTKEYTK